MLNIDHIVRHYLVAALWSSTDEHGEPLDHAYDLDSIAAETRQAARRDCADFVNANQTLLIDSGIPEEQIGHDFWLTRNGHGAGFWDRGLGDIGQALTEQCRPYGEVNLYVGDDGLVHA